jgi:ArsR family transcriptional regulator, arsenate/arsenite/antimonite-responsive transcriptional repressor
MGTTKTDYFSERENQLALLLKALGHPARVAIIEHLLKVNACICGDLVKELPLAQPTISQHLKELKNAGIIKGSIEGNAICYCIEEKAIDILKEYFTGVASKLLNHNISCC